jgi:hypothetical protein
MAIIVVAGTNDAPMVGVFFLLAKSNVVITSSGLKKSSSEKMECEGVPLTSAANRQSVRQRLSRGSISYF